MFILDDYYQRGQIELVLAIIVALLLFLILKIIKANKNK